MDEKAPRKDTSTILWLVVFIVALLFAIILVVNSLTPVPTMIEAPLPRGDFSTRSDSL